MKSAEREVELAKVKAELVDKLEEKLQKMSQEKKAAE